jgi:hypothetical protein
MTLTINDVKRTNQEAGKYFFSKDTMNFFKSRIETDLYKNTYFITSEQGPIDTSPRRFTIRKAVLGGRDIVTASEFQRYKTLESAKAAMLDLCIDEPQHIP